MQKKNISLTFNIPAVKLGRETQKKKKNYAENTKTNQIMAPLQAINIQLPLFIARQPNKLYYLDVNLSQLK